MLCSRYVSSDQLVRNFKIILFVQRAKDNVHEKKRERERNYMFMLVNCTMCSTRTKPKRTELQAWTQQLSRTVCERERAWEQERGVHFLWYILCACWLEFLFDIFSLLFINKSSFNFMRYLWWQPCECVCRQRMHSNRTSSQAKNSHFAKSAANRKHWLTHCCSPTPIPIPILYFSTT